VPNTTTRKKVIAFLPLQQIKRENDTLKRVIGKRYCMGRMDSQNSSSRVDHFSIILVGYFSIIFSRTGAKISLFPAKNTFRKKKRTTTGVPTYTTRF